MVLQLFVRFEFVWLVLLLLGFGDRLVAWVEQLVEFLYLFVDY